MWNDVMRMSVCDQTQLMHNDWTTVDRCMAIFLSLEGICLKKMLRSDAQEMKIETFLSILDEPAIKVLSIKLGISSPNLRNQYSFFFIVNHGILRENGIIVVSCFSRGPFLPSSSLPSSFRTSAMLAEFAGNISKENFEIYTNLVRFGRS